MIKLPNPKITCRLKTLCSAQRWTPSRRHFTFHCWLILPFRLDQSNKFHMCGLTTLVIQAEISRYSLVNQNPNIISEESTFIAGRIEKSPIQFYNFTRHFFSSSGQLFHLHGVQLFSNQKASQIEMEYHRDSNAQKHIQMKKSQYASKLDSNLTKIPLPVRFLDSVSLRLRRSVTAWNSARELLVHCCPTIEPGQQLSSHKPHARQKIGGLRKK